MEKRILVVEVNWLGDVLLTTPFFRAIKKFYPGCYLGALVNKRQKDILLGNPFIDELIEFDEKKEQKSLAARLLFVQMLRRKRFNTALLIHRSFTRALLCRLSGIRRLVGFQRTKTKFLVDTMVPAHNDMHRMDKYLLLLKPLHIDVQERFAEVFLEEQEVRASSKLLAPFSSYRHFIGIHPGANWELKQWPYGHYAQLADQLMAEGVMVFLTGTEKEISLCDKIVSHMHYKPCSLAGKLSLREFAAFLKRLHLFISADTGAMHLCSAVCGRTLSLFGPTSSALTGPRGKGASYVIEKEINCAKPCYVHSCHKTSCMSEITPEEVVGKVHQILRI